MEFVLGHVSDVPSVEDGYVLATFSVSARGEGLFLFAETERASDLHPRENTNFASFARSKLEQNVRYKLVKLCGHARMDIDLGIHMTSFPMVDVFPDGRVLLVGPRCSWRGPDDYDHNGSVILPGEFQSHNFLLGDGISGCMIDTRGQIWVSYFDEGIFGNNGWGNPGPRPVGQPGLACFDDSGNILWTFEDSGSMGRIDDVYALNVAGDNAFFYFYSDFLLGRANRQQEVKFYQPQLSGCKWFAINNQQAVFSGAYGDPVHQAFRLPRDKDGTLGKSEKILLKLPDCQLPSNSTIFARDDSIHFCNEVGWYRLGLDEIEAN